jgi:hypothetical protein
VRDASVSLPPPRTLFCLCHRHHPHERKTGTAPQLLPLYYFFSFFFNPDSTTLALLISPWRAIHIHLVRRFFPFGVSVDSSMK